MPIAKRHPLETLRLLRDWTYTELAEAVFQTTGCRRTPHGLRRVCLGEVEPYETTKDAIDRFLAAGTWQHTSKVRR